MLRYIIGVWQARSQEESALARLAATRLRASNCSWLCVLDAPESFVYCIRDKHSTDDILRIPGCDGIVLGTLFDSAADTSAKKPQVKAITAAVGSRIGKSFGQSLVDSHWGSYVLFLRRREEHSVCIFRGPMSRLPCFHTVVRNFHLFFSCMDDIVSLALFRPSIDFASIRAQATMGDYLTAKTAINEVDSVLPGEALDLSPESFRRKVYWSPQLLAGSPRLDTFAEAVSVLETGARRCVNSWSSLHDKLIVTLSGGFDSSTVLALVQSAPHAPTVVGLNYFDKAALDEREFARSMSRKYGCQLVERRLSDHVDFRKFLSCELTAAPVLHFTAFDSEAACVQLAETTQSSAIFGGELGDEIFGRAVGPEVLVDCMWQNGVGRTLVGAAADYAQFKRISVVRALAEAFRFRSFQASRPHWSIYWCQKEFAKDHFSRAAGLVSDEVVAEYERNQLRFTHPWLRDVADVPPGWFQFVFGLITMTSTWVHSPFDRVHDSMFIQPLASQPLVESYSKIPARFHIRDGLSGAVARQAFSNLLSEEVLRRGRGKGTPEMWLVDAIDENRSFLNEFLLDGILVKERILDRKKLEAAISRELGNSKVYACFLVIQIYIEAWLRKWTEVRNAAAA
jgi:asparagine synthase (glutamine-hydrolysing)